MKKIFFLLVLSVSVILYGCNKNNKTENHDHDHAHEAHDHSHDHDHNHDHDAHTHGADCDHDHDHDTDHGHDDKNHNANNIEMSPEQAKSVGLEVMTVQPAEFCEVIKTGGRIISAQGDEKTISANVSGIVVFNKKSVTEGAQVQSGEVLISISTKNIADGDVVVRIRNAYEAAKREYDRANTLMEDKLISQKEYNDIKLNYENAKASYHAFENNNSASGASVRTPMSGYVKSCLVTEGQYVEVGQPLIVVTQNRRLQLQAEVSEKYYTSLPTIRSANFKTAYDNKLHQLSEMNGRVTSYGRSASENSFLIPINFEFDNVGNVMSGSFAEVFLLGQKKENAIVVPITALVEEQGVFYTFIKLDDFHYTRREVKLGASDGENVEILSGLAVGDNVVSKGAYHVKLASLSAAIPHGHSH